MVKVLILYYSRGGRTDKLAKAIAEGAEAEGAETVMKRVDYATGVDLLECDAVALGTPNYFSYMAGLMKDYFDRTLGLRPKIEGKPAAAFTSGGGDSDSALLTLEKMIGSFRLEKVADGVVSVGDPTESDLASCKSMGKALAKAAKKREAEPTE